MIELLQGDCLVESEKIKSGSVDLILTDLPYGTVQGIGGNDDIAHGMVGKTKWDVAIDPARVYDIANRILRRNGKLVLFSQEPYTTRLITEAIPNLPFGYRMIWEKDHFANSLIAKKAPVSYYEDILVFSKTHGFGNSDEVREYLNEERKKAKMTLDEMCAFVGLNDKGHGGAAYHWCSSKQPSMIPRKHYDKLKRETPFFKEDYDVLLKAHKDAYKDFRSVFNLWEGGKYKSNILRYKKDYDGYHPTQKPVALLGDLIKTYSNEGDTVVDLTMGSGSTGVACLNTNRKFIGVELDETYFNIAKERIENHEVVE